MIKTYNVYKNDTLICIIHAEKYDIYYSVDCKCNFIEFYYHGSIVVTFEYHMFTFKSGGNNL